VIPLSRFPRSPEKPLPITYDLWYTALVVAVNALLVGIQTGEGDPDGVLVAPQGTIWRRTDGGSGTTLYAKVSGGTDPTTLTDTGWEPFA